MIERISLEDYQNRFSKEMDVAPRFKEITSGGGNCPFNAFILAIVSPGVLQHLRLNTSPENAQALISKIANALNIKLQPNTTIPNQFNRITSAMVDLRLQNPFALQSLLHGVFRELAVFLANTNPKGIEQTQPSMLAAFDEFYTLKRNSTFTPQDDIYLQHKSVTQKFEEVYDLVKDMNELDPDIDRIRDQHLKGWWKETGYKGFLEEMSQPGEWAGDYELGLLANFFGLALNIYQKDKLISPSHYGQIEITDLFTTSPDASDEAMQRLLDELVDRGVVQQPDQSDKSVLISLPDEESILKRLGKIPQADLVFKIAGETEQPLTGKILVSTGLSHETIDELIKRNIISSEKGSVGVYTFSVDLATLTRRINPIQNADQEHLSKIIADQIAIRTHIYLFHRYCHWSNTASEQQKELLLKTKEEQLMEEEKANEHSNPDPLDTNLEGEEDTESTITRRKKPKLEEDRGEKKEEDVENEEQNTTENEFIAEYESDLQEQGIKYDANKWRRWTEMIQNGENLDEIENSVNDELHELPTRDYEEKINYKLSNGKIVEVSEKVQIALDREYAKKVHESENPTPPRMRKP